MDILEISNELNNMVCSVHHQSATVVLIQNPEGSLESVSQISIKGACCDGFVGQIQNRSADLLTENIGEQVLNQLKW